MPKQAYRVHNWKDYNKSLVQRGSLTFWFSKDIMKAWTNGPTEDSHGNAKYSNAVIQFALTLQQIFRFPLRATQGMLHSIVKLSRLNVSVPDYTTLCRRGKKLQVDLKVRSTKKPRHVLVDSTGVQVFGEGEWLKFRHGESRSQLWRKLHIAIDADNGTILSGIVTESTRHDANYFLPLLENINSPICQVTGDGAYDKKKCYRAAYDRGAKGIFPPQHNAAIQRRKKDPALLARDKAIEEIGRGPKRKEKLNTWKIKNDYHKRSRVETMMWRMKTIFSDQVRARSIENQKTSLLVRCSAINKMNSLGLPITSKI
jgi:hypothetical protein